MPRKLTPAQVEGYRTQGYVAPLDAFSLAEARAFRDQYEALERAAGGKLPVERQRKLHLFQPWAAEMVHHPAILDAVEDLIGPDILLYTMTTWIKEPRTDAFISWHQDSTTFGLSPLEHVTAWVALSDSSIESGAVQVIPGSHLKGQLPHHAIERGANILPSSSSVQIDTAAPIERLVLRPGQFSLHHTCLVHSSMPNRSDDRRIGLGISYIPAHVRCSSPTRLTAMLVRGQDRYGHFLPEQRPDPDRLDEAERRHAEIMARWTAARQVMTRQSVIAMD